MTDSGRHSTYSSDTPTDIGEEPQTRLKLLLGTLTSHTDNEDESPQPSEDTIDTCVTQVLKSIKEKILIRRRNTILQALEGCKSRIVSALEDCNEDVNIPWDDEALLKQAKDFEFSKETTDEMRRKEEQSAIMCRIDRYIKSCQKKILGMEKLFRWMSGFTLEFTWDEVGMSSVDDREKDRNVSYRGIMLALQRVWECATKMKQLIELLVSDDIYDVISGNYSTAKRKRGIGPRKMWCSNKLRVKLDEYEKMRRRLELQQEKKMTTKQQKLSSVTQKQVTVRYPGDDSGSPKDAYKETEATILQEINRCWKHAMGDISFYMQEVMSHRFSKTSCRVRLGRAMLMLEFVCAAIEGRILEAEQKEKELEETKANVVRYQEESRHQHMKLSDANRTNQAAQRKISKLKRQLESVTTDNQKLEVEIEDMNDKIESLMKEVEELQQMPVQQDSEENLLVVEDREIKLVESEISHIWAQLEDCKKECETVKGLLVQEKEINLSLSEDIVVLEEEKSEGQAKLAKMEKKLSDQGTNVASFRLMVYYKDEVIRRLKRALIELQSYYIAKKDSGEVTQNEEQKVDVPAATTQESSVKKGDNDPSAKSDVISAKPDVISAKGGKRREQPKTTKAIDVPMEYKELKNEYDKTFREMVLAKRELQKERDDFDYKLRDGLEEERRKSLVESMKIEEERQLLNHIVKDETMRIQKEMRKFADSIGEELNSVLGFKGRLMDGLLPKTGGRATEGLKTNVNISFDSSSDPDSLHLGDGTPIFEFPLEGDFMSLIGPMMFGQDSFPGHDQMPMFTGEEVEMSTGGLGGMPPSDTIAEIPSTINSQTDEPVDQQEKSHQKQSVNYWKCLRDALHGRSVDAKAKLKENEQILQISDMLGQRQKARDEQKKALDEISRDSELSLTNTGSIASSVSSINIPGVSTGKPPLTNEELRNSKESFKTAQQPNKEEDPSPDSALKAPENDRGISEPAMLVVRDIVCKEPKDEETSMRKSHENLDVMSSSGKVRSAEHVPERGEEPEKGRLRTVISRHTSESNASVFVDDKNASLEDQPATLGDRRRSSEMTFHPPALPIKVRTPEAEPSEKGVRIRGFYGLGPEQSSYLTVHKNRSNLPLLAPNNLKPKIQKEPDSAKEAERYVRIISQQVAEFLGHLGTRLGEIIRQNKEEMTSKMLAMEEGMLRDKVKYKAEIECVQIEKKEKEKELKHIEQTLNDRLAMRSTSIMVDDRNIHPHNLVQHLKEAEFDLEDATLRMYKAAERHVAGADEYRYLSKSLEGRLKMAEEEKFRLQKKMKRESQTTNSLRILLHNVLNSQKQTLFLRLRDHKHNANIIKMANNVNSDTKKVALCLLRRSMLYPEESLRLLVQHYCKYVKFTGVQERLRQQIVKSEKSSPMHYTKEPRDTRKKAILTNFLAGVAVRRELASQRMAEKRKLLAAERQRMFIKMALFMHKLSIEKQDLSLIQPEIHQVYGKGCRRSRYNMPVPREFSNLTLLLPKSDIVPLPEVSYSPPEVRMPPARGDGANLILKGHKPPLNLQRLKAAAPHWFPEDSLCCPFSRSGNISQTNLHASVGRFKRKHGYMDVDTPTNEFAWVKSPEFRAEIPRIMELEIHSGLREARKSVMMRLQVGMPIASSTSIEATPLSSSNIANRHYNSPFTQYEKYLGQNIDTYWPGDLTKTKEDLTVTNSLDNLFSSLRCPLPRIPTHRDAVTGQRRQEPIEVAVPPASFHRSGDTCDFSSPLSARPSIQNPSGLSNR